MESLGKSQGQNRQTQPVPWEYHAQCYIVEVQTLVELNPNILVRYFRRMYFHHYAKCAHSRKIAVTNYEMLKSSWILNGQNMCNTSVFCNFVLALTV